MAALDVPTLQQVVNHRHHGQQQQDHRQRYRRQKTDVLEADCANEAARKKHQQQQRQQAQFLTVGEDQELVRAVLAGIPVQLLAKFDADIGHDAGDMGSANLCLG